VEALVRMAFRETLRQKIHGWNTAIVSLKCEFCSVAGKPRADITFQIEKLVAKRTVAAVTLLQLGQPPPERRPALQVSNQSA